MKKITAYAPASIGNVSLGFDLLGAALAPVDGSQLGDRVTVESADKFSLQVSGRFADRLPADPDTNIVTRCHHHFVQQLAGKSVEATPVRLHLDKHLPIGSGLGSSASSIVAALHGLNHYYDSPFSQVELLKMMGELEGQISGSVHYDNVAPCYLGGLTLMAEQADNIAIPLPCFDNWYWVACYSGISVSTAAAREILPKQTPLSTTIQFGRQLAVFLHALHAQDEALAVSVMHDVVAEPYRKSLLPYFDQSRQFASDNGALAFGISGSGPTVFALCNSLEKAQTINQWLIQHYIQNEDGFSHVCQLDTKGAVAE